MLLITIKQQDLLRDGQNIPDSIAYFTRVYMICLRSWHWIAHRPAGNDSAQLY